jgi:hypothetical protein
MSAFVTPAAGSAFSPALPRTPTAARAAPAADAPGHAASGGEGGGTPKAMQAAGAGRAAGPATPTELQMQVSCTSTQRHPTAGPVHGAIVIGVHHQEAWSQRAGSGPGTSLTEG